MRNLSFFLLLVLFFACAPNPAPVTTADVHDHGAAVMTTASPAAARAGSVVQFAAPVPGASGYLALPASAGKHPAIIVIQEWWGLNDWIREQTDRFAQQGYVALAVDLYRGRVAGGQEEAHELSRGLPEDRALGDLKAAFEYLGTRDDVDASRIGVIGWCMGGGYALGLATVEPRLDAAVINYGRLVTDPATISRIEAPILGNFGATDRGITVEDVKKFEAALQAAGKAHDIKIHEGAGHAFMNPNNTAGYDAAATTDAWKRIDAFFAQKLAK